MSLRSFLLVGALAMSASVSAQPSAASASGPQVWVEGAAEAMASPMWIGGSVGVGVEFERASVRLGLSGSNSFALRGDGVESTALSVTGGIHQEFGALRLAAQAGPALVWGTKPSQGPDNQSDAAVGAVGGVLAMVGVGRHLRLGAEAQVTASSLQTVVGGGPALQVLLWR